MASRSKFVFTPSFIFCSPICYNNGDVVFFLWKYILVFENLLFFIRPLKYANFHLEYHSSCVTSCNDSTWPPTFLSTHAFVLSSKLNPLLSLKLAKKYLFFGEYFCKVTVKVSLCICVVLSWDKVKVRKNSLDSDYGMYMVRLLVATVNWHKSLQFVKKSNITFLPCLFVNLSAVSIITLRLCITFWQEPRFCVVFSPPPFISWASHAIINTDTNEYLPCIKTFFKYYFELRILEYVLFSVTNRCFSGSTGGQITFFVFRCWRGGKAIGNGWGCLCCTS